MTRKLGKNRDLLLGIAFTSPWILGMAVFLVYPLGVSLYYSFTDYNLLSTPFWIGWENYQFAMGDSIFGVVLRNTLSYSVIMIPLSLLLALVLALLLSGLKWTKALGSLVYLPATVPLIVLGLVFQWMYNGEFGIINYVLGAIGIAGPPWLTTTAWIKPAIGIVNVFLLGPMVLINLAGLQSVPTELYEAARLETDSTFQEIWHITLPMISPVILYNLVMQIIAVVQIFDIPYALTAGVGAYSTPGGPNYASTFYSMYITEVAFKQYDMGYASALAWLLFLGIAFFTWLVMSIGRKLVYYAAE